jgi:hypothetical protein
MADSNDVTIDRTPGQNPVRTDKRGILHMLHDELGKQLGIGQAVDRNVNDAGQKKGLMDAVDDAVTGAPNKPSDY